MSAAPIDDLADQVSALFKERVKAFLAWASENWAVSEKDRNDEVFRDMPDKELEAYNAGIRSMPDAFGVYCEEYWP